MKQIVGKKHKKQRKENRAYSVLRLNWTTGEEGGNYLYFKRGQTLMN